MKLYRNERKYGELNTWRGRHRNYRVTIHEVFNEELQTVDKYRFTVSSTLKEFYYDSEKHGEFYKNIDSTKNAALKVIIDAIHKFSKRQKAKERPVLLVSKNIHNFRHGKEAPMIMGLVHYTPEGLDERLCFKVKYASDGKIDHIAYSEFINGNWEIMQ